MMLVFLRVLSPASKKESFENMSSYFLDFNFELADVYRALGHFNRYKDDLLINTHEMVRMVYGRDLSRAYYDVTNYYFEINEPDELRKKRCVKRFSA